MKARTTVIGQLLTAVTGSFPASHQQPHVRITRTPLEVVAL
jgi:hypothetical protein